eukprot:TRINITY_DN12700_c0_g1_i2.p1 TRINITY_DN12700_c0_g1~~TRINITY_DN12700_c0_g1_i2.p1  ORF type:complete len:571 (+),score=84.29 TRINITY_DN12700_c0_g1_i2:42-1754(+)
MIEPDRVNNTASIASEDINISNDVAFTAQTLPALQHMGNEVNSDHGDSALSILTRFLKENSIPWPQISQTLKSKLLGDLGSQWTEQRISDWVAARSLAPPPELHRSSMQITPVCLTTAALTATLSAFRPSWPPSWEQVSFASANGVTESIGTVIPSPRLRPTLDRPPAVPTHRRNRSQESEEDEKETPPSKRRATNVRKRVTTQAERAILARYFVNETKVKCYGDLDVRQRQLLLDELGKDWDSNRIIHWRAQHAHHLVAISREPDRPLRITSPEERELLTRHLEYPNGVIRLWRDLSHAESRFLLDQLNALGHSSWDKNRIQMWRNARAARTARSAEDDASPLDTAAAAAPVQSDEIQELSQPDDADCAPAAGPSDEVEVNNVDNTDDDPICGVLNRHGRPCKRVGRCPFHSNSSGALRSDKKYLTRSDESTSESEESTPEDSSEHEDEVEVAWFYQGPDSADLDGMYPAGPSAHLRRVKLSELGLGSIMDDCLPNMDDDESVMMVQSAATVPVCANTEENPVAIVFEDARVAISEGIADDVMEKPRFHPAFRPRQMSYHHVRVVSCLS